MTDLISIDPGYAADGEGCAVASFFRSALVATWFERPGEPGRAYRDAAGVDAVVVERPQQDERTRGIPPEVLAKLSWDGALLAGLYAGHNNCPVVALTPTEWKGSASKPIHHKQLWKVLSEAERGVLGGSSTFDQIQMACEKGALDRWKKPGVAYYPKSFTLHNILDAVALGCVYLKRLRKI